MPQIGEAQIGFKQGAWRGMTTLSKSKPAHFELLENGYVSSDGSEIRTWPGYVPIVTQQKRAR